MKHTRELTEVREGGGAPDSGMPSVPVGAVLL